MYDPNTKYFNIYDKEGSWTAGIATYNRTGTKVSKYSIYLKSAEWVVLALNIDGLNTKQYEVTSDRINFVNSNKIVALKGQRNG